MSPPAVDERLRTPHTYVNACEARRRRRVRLQGADLGHRFRGPGGRLLAHHDAEPEGLHVPGPDQPVEWAAVCVGASSFHPGGVNVGFLDGSVRFVKDGVNPQTWWGIATRAGGEVIDASRL